MRFLLSKNFGKRHHLEYVASNDGERILQMARVFRGMLGAVLLAVGVTIASTDVSFADEAHSLQKTSSPLAHFEEETVTTEDGSVLKWKPYGDSGTAMICGYVSLTSDLVIPESINGMPVVAIADTMILDMPLPTNVFEGADDLESVTLPDSLRVICGMAFMDCTALREVNMPEHLSYLGMSAFSGCFSLKSIVVPEGITSIPQVAFTECYLLEEVALPNTLKSISDGAFASCLSLKSIDIPDSVTVIGGGAFEGCQSLSGITLPRSLKTIAATAFRSCPDIDSVYVPGTVTSMGDECFNSGVLILTDAGLSTARSWARANGNEYISGTLDDYSNHKYIMQVDWNGEPHEPEVILRNANHDEFPMEYADVAYANNVNAGTATYTVTSSVIGGKQTGEFEIRAIRISNADLAPIETQYYFGEPLCPKVSLTHQGYELVEGTDFTCAYSRNATPGSQGRVEITGIGNFSGVRSEYFDVEAGKVTITFQTNGGSAIAPFGGNYGSSSEVWRYAEANPTTRDGYEFIGWFSDESLTQPWNIYTDKPMSDMTLYAKWEKVDSSDPDPGADPSSIVFDDVFAGVTDHASHIQWLADEGVSKGWDNGDGTYSYRPYAPVARADMAAFLYRLAGSPAFEPTAADWARFTDVSSSTPHCKEVLWLASAGISEGWDADGDKREFRPYANIARADMAAFLNRLADWLGAPEPTGQAGSFHDVPASMAHSESVAWLSAAGITTGFGDGTYRPYDTIKRCDMAAMLHRLDGFVEGYEMA
ncbi:MAG: leucine-rich repeat protein [Eggerthellaceae bacterium]